MQQQLMTMLELQDSMNTRVHPQWREQGHAWYRAIWVECAELMDHFGWKWWKRQQPDMEQVKLELIDIWHFGLSDMLQHSTTGNKAIAELIQQQLSNAVTAGEFREVLEIFTGNTLITRSFDLPAFHVLMAAAELSFEELYIGYVGKNVLNFFRQDHGYKEGTYIKVWAGREDNEHLVEISVRLDHTSVTFKDELYSALKERYQGLAEH